MSGYAPATLQDTIAAIWQELLGRTSVATDDNFFELGGHSILAAQMLFHLEEELGLLVPLWLVFEAPVLGDFVAAAAAQ